jgi:photosystem II stability/assembly factor-like uncharacterized protein
MTSPARYCTHSLSFFRPVPALPGALLVSLFLLSGCGAPADRAASDEPTLTWETQYEDSTALFIGLHAVDAQTVWVAGTGGRVGRTVDGGTTWEINVVPGTDSLQFRDVHGVSADVAFALTIGNGTDSRIYRTDDGGTTWTESFRNEDPNAFFDCLSFWDDDRGFAFSDSFEGEFTLLRTMDGGASWSRIDPAVVPDAHPGEGAFAASGTCVVTRPGGLGWFVTGASGVDSRVIRTTDYGDSWEETISPIPSDAGTAGIFSLAMTTDTDGMIFGGDFAQPDSVFANAAVTADGGASWTMVSPAPIGGSIFGGSAVPGVGRDGGHAYVGVAPTGSAWTLDSGATWTRIDSTAFWTVHFHGPDAGWAAGPGRIARAVIRNLGG